MSRRLSWLAMVGSFFVAAGAVVPPASAQQFGEPQYQFEYPFGAPPQQQQQSQYQQQQQVAPQGPAFDFNALLPLLEEWGNQGWEEGQGYSGSRGQRRQAAPPTREQLLLLPPAQLREILQTSAGTMQDSLERLRNGDSWVVYLELDKLRAIAAGDLRPLDQEAAGLLATMAESTPPQQQARSAADFQSANDWLRELHEQLAAGADPADALAIRELQDLVSERQQQAARAERASGCLEESDVLQLKELAGEDARTQEDLERVRAFLASQIRSAREREGLDEDILARLRAFLEFQQEQAAREESNRVLARLHDFIQQRQEEQEQLTGEQIERLRAFLRSQVEEEDEPEQVMLLQFVDEEEQENEEEIMLLQFADRQEDDDVPILLQFSEENEPEAVEATIMALGTEELEPAETTIMPLEAEVLAPEEAYILPLDTEEPAAAETTIMPLEEGGGPQRAPAGVALVNLNDLALAFAQRGAQEEPSRAPDGHLILSLQQAADAAEAEAARGQRCGPSVRAMQAEQLRQVVGRYEAAAAGEGDISPDQRQALQTIARRFEQTAEDPSFSLVSRRADFQTLRAVVGALATAPAEREMVGLRSALNSLSASLDRTQNGSGWKRYLGLESLHRTISSSDLGTPDRELLASALEHFDEVATNPDYRPVSELTGFADARERLQRLIAVLDGASTP